MDEEAGDASGDEGGDEGSFANALDALKIAPGKDSCSEDQRGIESCLYIAKIEVPALRDRIDDALAG